MSFRTRQKLKLSSSCEIFLREDKTLENGEVVAGYSSTTSDAKDMPDPEMFRLSNQLAAGVKLEEVNSKVLSPKSLDLSKVLTVKKEVKNNEN